MRFARQLLMAGAVLASCDRGAIGARPAQRNASAAPSTTAAADTVVRRVGRVTRRASAIQRVTGVIRATRALQPLDSILVVRVFDQRGEELRGARVRWTAPNAASGSSLHVRNDVTDTLGLSRAVFTPGTSADVQLVSAEVDGVGRIEFSMTLPPARIRIAPDRAVIWAESDSVLGAEIQDAAGHILSGGTLSWATTDTSAIRVRALESSRVQVTGALAGTTTLVAWAGDGTVRDSSTVIVRPVARGRFVTLDGGTAALPTEIVLRAGGAQQTIPVRDGVFAARVDMPLETEVEMTANAADSTYHDIRVRFGAQREMQNVKIALVPTAVTVDAGAFAGRRVAVDAAAAMRRPARSAPFWRLVPLSGRGPRKLLGWREVDFPLHIAFDRARTAEPITAEDSTRFWAIARDLERDVGRALFAPANMSDTARVNVVPVEVQPQESQAHTFVSWAQAGNATNGVMLFRRAALLRDPHVVTHELVHLLGFGHSTQWPTVSQPAGGTQPALTIEDVGYIQLAMRLRRLQEQTGARPGLPLSVQ